MKFPVYTRTIGDVTAWGGVDPKNPLFAQHWVVWMGLIGGKHAFHWGQYQDPVYKTQQELIDLVTAGTPNCVFEVR